MPRQLSLHSSAIYHLTAPQSIIPLLAVPLQPVTVGIQPMYPALHIPGTDITITGAGFGSDSAALDVLVGGVPCAVSSMHLDGLVSAITCRVAYRPPGTAEVVPMAAGRGARWRSG